MGGFLFQTLLKPLVLAAGVIFLVFGLGVLVTHAITIVPNQDPVIEYFYADRYLSEFLTCKAVYFNFKACDEDDYRLSGSIDFGDGETQSLENITCGRWTIPHVYQEFGGGSETYEVTLTLSDPDGGSAIATTTVTIRQIEVKSSQLKSGVSGCPSLDVGYFRLPPPSLSCQCQDTVVNEDTTCSAEIANIGSKTVSSYKWDLDEDGDFDDATGEDITVSAPHSEGVNWVKVQGSFDGETLTSGCNFHAYSSGPTASFSFSPLNPAVNETVSFDASASTGDIVSYSWDFGDGETSTGQTTTHSYSAEGNYDVKLTVEDSAGKTDTETKTVAVSSAGSPGQVDVVVHGDIFDQGATNQNLEIILTHSKANGQINRVENAQLTFDHEVIEITNIEVATPGYSLTKNIDNANDTANFSLTSSNPQKEVTVILTMDIVGSEGDETTVSLKNIDQITDPQGNILSYTTESGLVHIGPPTGPPSVLASVLETFKDPDKALLVPATILFIIISSGLIYYIFKKW